MVRRVCRVFGNAKDIVVLNDEAHHCYTPAPPEESAEGGLDADERTEARKNAEEARVWFDGLKAVRDKIGIRERLRRVGHAVLPEGLRLPGGHAVPVGGVRLRPDGRDRIRHREDPPRARVGRLDGRRPARSTATCGSTCATRSRARASRTRPSAKATRRCPKELEGALQSLYGDYERSYDEWAGAGMGRPPVFIVVCSNTSVSKLVYDWIAGYDRTLQGGETVAAPGKLPLFSNVDGDRWRHRPVTLLIDSMQLDRGDALDPAFKKAAAHEIEEFKREYIARFPGRSADDLTTRTSCARSSTPSASRAAWASDIRCVVSVSMLTEGWDANTVTHVLGHPRLRHAAPVRAGRRPGTPSRELRPDAGRHVRARVRRGLRRAVHAS